jgi:cytochrome c oxidase assembly protein subunit 15
MNLQATRQRQCQLALFTSLLAFCVVLMGAYVRLSDAGLGCPDWPGCYGMLTVPDREEAVVPPDNDFAKPLQPEKAWKEMIHRYLAGTLGLFILLLTLLAWRNRRDPLQPLGLPSLLLGLVLFQAALGMWTVTLLVKPAIVTAHLLGGFATFVLLVLLALQLRPAPLLAHRLTTAATRRLILLGLAVVIAQVTLGGWTSTNYAALGCSDFPGCYADQWWPAMDFREGFTLWRGLGVNYEFGVLENDARSAIHMTHRIGALVTLLLIGWLALRLLRHNAEPTLRKLGGLTLLLLVTQITLGITNVLGHLPLPVAVAHNGIAALLLATLATLTWPGVRHAR